MHVEFEVEIVHAVFEPLHPLCFSFFCDKFVEPVLVNDTFEIAYQSSRNKAGFASHPVAQDLIDVDEIGLCHDEQITYVQSLCSEPM